MLDVKIIDTNLAVDVRTKTAARCLIIKDNKVAILYSKKYGFYMTPGGGVEVGETLEQACAREAKEETGLIVKPVAYIASLHTNYPTITITHHYYVCELLEDQLVTSFTEQEQDQDLDLVWFSFAEAKQAFATLHPHPKYDKWMQREAFIVSELRSYLD